MSQQYTVTLNTPLKDLLLMCRDLGHSKTVARFDLGNGAEAAFVCFAVDSDGYLGAVEAYEEGRDRYATNVANAVCAHVAEHGLPDPEKGERLNLQLGAWSNDAEDYISNDSNRDKKVGGA